MALALSLFIGFFSGLRSLTPPAILAWAAYFGWLSPQSPFTWIGTLPSVLILSLLAVAELIADKLPKTPNRTAPPGFIARIVSGGFCGACLAAAANQGMILGAVLGITGAIAGTFAGFKARGQLANALAGRNILAALIEDAIAIGGSLFIATRF